MDRERAGGGLFEYFKVKAIFNRISDRSNIFNIAGIYLFLFKY